MFFKSMSRASMEQAEAAWQANEGSARQKCLAQLFMTSAANALRQLLDLHPTTYVQRREAQHVVHLVMRDFKREHYLECTLPDHLYWLQVDMSDPAAWFMPLTYTLRQSPLMEQLAEGKAPVRIECKDSPLYASGHGNWKKYVERMSKAHRFIY